MSKFIDMGLKVGDKVRCIKTNCLNYTVGKEYTLEKSDFSGPPVIKTGYSSFSGYLAEWEKAEDMEYEDKWELNDGTVDIPTDADTLEKDGSVVAFRRAKPRKPKVGDFVQARRNGYWSNLPRKVLYIHSEDPERTFYVVAYKGDVPSSHKLEDIRWDL